MLRFLCPVVAALALVALPLPTLIEGDGGKAEQMARLGSVTVGEYKGEVNFQYQDDGKYYRVDVLVPKPGKKPPINGERIEVWLLARGGKAVTLKERPRSGPLVEAGNDRGVSADAIFLFERTAARKDVVAVVVTVDGELTTLKVPPAVSQGAVKP